MTVRRDTRAAAVILDRERLDRQAAWLNADTPPVLAAVRRLTLSSAQPPWQDSGVTLAAGQYVTWYTSGETVLTDLPSIRVPARFQLWARCGGGDILRGTRASHSFAATRAGRLEFATAFPGEWATPQGALASDTAAYAAVHGDIDILLLVWAPGVDAASGLEALAAAADPAGLHALERARLEGTVSAPSAWHYLWFLGPSETYHSTPDHAGIACDCEADAAILHHEAPFALEPGTHLHWRWCIDELPSRVAEDTLPTHDYLSIAVEFDNGQDLTYLWSAALPCGTVFRCPIPTWHARETHAVVRTGSADLGRWMSEERDVHADYAAMIGGPMPARIVRVWLIAVSLFQHGRGRCRYDGIRLSRDGQQLLIPC